MDDPLLKMNAPITNWGILSFVLYVFLVLIYMSQSTMMAFNADDIIQAQFRSDSKSFITQGRWGYYLIYAKFQEAMPAPTVSTVLGIAMMLTYGLIGARILKFTTYLSAGLFVCFSSVSIYYCELYSFDSTRIAYPLANLFAISGLFLLFSSNIKKNTLGFVMLAIAPAFYPAATQLAAAILFCALITHCVDAQQRFTTKKLITITILFAASLIAYLFITKGLYYILDLHLTSKTSLDFFAVVNRWETIKCLFSNHSMPFLPESICSKRVPLDYFQDYAETVLAIIFIGFNVVVISILIKLKRPILIPVVLLLEFALLLTPYGLIFASKKAGFPTRSLYAQPYIYAFFGVYVLATIMDKKGSLAKWASRSLVFLLISMVLISAVDVANKSFQDYLTYQRNLFATNRVILDIEKVLSKEGQSKIRKLPMIVINTSPRVGGALRIYWSKERIFHLIDKRYIPASRAERKRVTENVQTSAFWPAPGSIYLDDKTLVVILSQ